MDYDIAGVFAHLHDYLIAVVLEAVNATRSFDRLRNLKSLDRKVLKNKDSSLPGY